jgi:hypothetical protein
MKLLAAEEREKRAEAFPVGCRVRSVRLAFIPGKGVDDNIFVPPGTEGWVQDEPDAAGSIPVSWDNGAYLSFLIEDQVERIDEGGSA